MEKYSVLLVDDEPEVIQIMLKKIDWEGLGFTVSGYAENGASALEMINQNPPDVVMTDIRMPYMDGMELSGHIREQYPDMRIVLFTGFDEFEYARTAIHLNISEYILKPVNAAELTETLTRIRADLDRERKEQQNIDTLMRYYNESLPAMQSRFAVMLLENQIAADQIERLAEEYRFSIEKPFATVAIFHVSRTHMPEGGDYQVLRMAVWRYAYDRLKDRWRVLFFSYQHDNVMIVQLDESTDIRRLTDECSIVARNAGHVTGAVVTVGIGRVIRSVSEIRDCWLGAREALSYRVIFGTGRAINIREATPGGKDTYEIGGEESIHNILQKIRMGDDASLREAVEEYFSRLSDHFLSLGQYRTELTGLVTAILQFARKNQIRMNEVADPYSNITGMDRAAFEDWILSVCLDLQHRLAAARTSSGVSYVDSARSIVMQNYQDPDLSIGDVCKSLGVSESYFSGVFKKTTGESFVSYLTRIRMEIAAQLLTETTDKSYVIGKKVGFLDANYFSYVFKKQYGVSPSRYRKKEEDK